MKKQFGLIGYPLSHSFSPGYFNKKFSMEEINANYESFPLKQIEDFCDLIKKVNFSGLNVTIPYKEAIIPYLDDIDNMAKEIGAVNTITFQNGKTKGYNTDVYGFEKSLMDLIKHSENITNALVLGTGGASKAVKYTLSRLNIPFQVAGRSLNGDITYDDLDKNLFYSFNLIINTTPLGMAPFIDMKPDIPYQWLNKKIFLYDLIYNPEKTIFLTEGLKKGCKIKNGYDMLILQAEQAWHIWNHT